MVRVRVSVRVGVRVRVEVGVEVGVRVRVRARARARARARVRARLRVRARAHRAPLAVVVRCETGLCRRHVLTVALARVSVSVRAGLSDNVRVSFGTRQCVRVNVPGSGFRVYI